MSRANSVYSYPLTTCGVAMPRTAKKARTLDPNGMGLSDARLMLEAQREANAWQARLKAGRTESDRNQPVCTSGCGGTETPISHLPDSVRIPIENELYGSTPDTE